MHLTNCVKLFRQEFCVSPSEAPPKAVIFLRWDLIRALDRLLLTTDSVVMAAPQPIQGTCLATLQAARNPRTANIHTLRHPR